MPVHRDPLADRLRVLARKGAIPASSLSQRQRGRLAPLFESGVLEEQRAGAGRRVVVKAKDALLDFAGKMFPADFGEEGEVTLEACSSLPRMEAVLCRRDSKAAGSTRAQPVLLRGFGSARLFSRGPGGELLPVADLTRLAGLAGLRLERPFRWGFEGAMAVVENLEVFLNVERLGLDMELVLYGGGRLSRLVLDWLSSGMMMRATVLHLGDYDPVGLSEYLRLKDAVGERARLYVPPHLKGLARRFGKASLVSGQTGILSRLRACGHQEVERLAEMLEECGCGLEQEVLLYHFPFADSGLGRKPVNGKS